MLQEAPARGSLTGFNTLFRKELGAWWSTRRWWVHALLWLALMNGFMVPVYFVVQAHPELSLDLMRELTDAFFLLGGVAVAIGAVVVGQDAIIGERQMGTADWILSKPVARTAFVLAKFAAQGISLAVLAVGLQAVIAYGQIFVLAGRSLEVLPFLAAVGLVCLNLLFYTAMVLMLGTLFRTRSLVLLVALGWLFAQPIAVDVFPRLATVTPYGLPDLGAALASGASLSEVPLLPAALALLWTAVFLVIALWRFEREEL
ncbi:MAG TPA: ABC transporter permease subunit [Symbiobacteriaceae bacterium]|nr:ABC transporter permease subunit [Symbiobacteriaceae bacterium]